MFCPKCGVQNPDDAATCSSCRVELPKYYAPGQAPQVVTAEQKLQASLAVLARRTANGGNWFYWIGGMSLLNTIIGLANGHMSFLTGLGVTQLFDHSKGSLAVLALPISLFFACVYALFGYFACRSALWAFVTGITLYSLDLLLCLALGFIPGVLFHGFALFCIVQGLKALMQAQKLKAQAMPQQQPPQPPTLMRS